MVTTNSQLDTAGLKKFHIDRRQFLKIGAAALVTSLCPLMGVAFSGTSSFPSRRLSFYNTHTDEHLDVIYCTKGRHCPEGLSAINHILRDHRTGDVHAMDIKLINQLFALSSKLNTREPFHVISGYRSPTTNDKLRKHGGGVAKNSFHLKGRAVDIRLPSVPLAKLKETAIQLNGGGVGYYPQSDFIHLDSGPIRIW